MLDDASFIISNLPFTSRSTQHDDSQELLVDYDNRSDVNRELALNSIISPSQTLVQTSIPWKGRKGKKQKYQRDRRRLNNIKARIADPDIMQEGSLD